MAFFVSSNNEANDTSYVASAVMLCATHRGLPMEKSSGLVASQAAQCAAASGSVGAFPGKE